MKFNAINVELSLMGVGSIQGTWMPDESEQQASWELYVELITRISLITNEKYNGSLREALDSLHSLFGTTRQILKNYGPNIARPKNGNNLSLGYISIIILNNILRPFLLKWHPLLTEFESKKPNNQSLIEHEKNWNFFNQFNQELREIQKSILDYANLLAEAADVPYLVLKSN